MRHHAPTVDQEQGVAGAEVAQVDRAHVAARRVEIGGRVGVVELHVANLGQAAQQVIAGFGAGGLDRLLVEHHDWGHSGLVGRSEAATHHQHTVQGRRVGGGFGRFLGRGWLGRLRLRLRLRRLGLGLRGVTGDDGAQHYGKDGFAMCTHVVFPRMFGSGERSRAKTWPTSRRYQPSAMQGISDSSAPHNCKLCP